MCLSFPHSLATPIGVLGPELGEDTAALDCAKPLIVQSPLLFLLTGTVYSHFWSLRCDLSPLVDISLCFLSVNKKLNVSIPVMQGFILRISTPAALWLSIAFLWNDDVAMNVKNLCLNG